MRTMKTIYDVFKWKFWILNNMYILFRITKSMCVIGKDNNSYIVKGLGE